MKHQTEHAQLYLNDDLVGDIDVQGVETAWHFGTFRPNEAFSRYAPHFGRWALLMHEDEHLGIGRELSQELREAEIAIDRLAARLHYPEKDQWRRIMQLNIDGPLIEWIQSSVVMKR
jgi:hypothetical protein